MEVSTNAQPSTASRSVPRTWLLVLSVVFTVSWFSLLASRPLFEPDEGRYAEIPREMAAGGDWIIPHLDGIVYIEKPPLQYWLTASVFKVFGENEFTARFCTGTAGYLCIVLVSFVASTLWGSRAALRAFLLLSASSLFVLLGHQLTLDMMLTWWLTACLCCFLLAQQYQSVPRRAHGLMLGSWAAMALAVLTKGLIGAVIPTGTLVVYALWQRDYRVFRRIHFASGFVLFGVLAVPWFVAAAHACPDFLSFFFVREHFQRFLTPIEHRSEPWWFFATVMVLGVLPWLPQAARALLYPSRSAIVRGRYDPQRILRVWCLFVLIFFSMSNAKLIPYILPAVPALALLCAVRDSESHERSDLRRGACLSLAAALALLVYAGGEVFIASALTVTLRAALIPTALIVALGGVAALLMLLRQRPEAALGVLCVGGYLACVGLLLGADDAQRFFSAKAAVPSLNTASASPIFSVGTYDQSLPFYLRRTVTLVAYRDEFDFGLRLNPELGIATLDEFSRRWLALDEAYAIMPRRLRRTLAAQGLPMRQIGTFQHDVVVARR